MAWQPLPDGLFAISYDEKDDATWTDILEVDGRLVHRLEEFLMTPDHSDAWCADGRLLAGRRPMLDLGGWLFDSVTGEITQTAQPPWYGHLAGQLKDGHQV